MVNTCLQVLKVGESLQCCLSAKRCLLPLSSFHFLKTQLQEVLDFLLGFLPNYISTARGGGGGGGHHQYSGIGVPLRV